MTTIPPVLILHNAPPGSPGERDYESQAGVLAEAAAVAEALTSLGCRHRVLSARAYTDLPNILAASAEPVVFSLVEGFAGCPDGDALATLVPALCQAFAKGCTGNDASALGVALDKGRTRALLSAAGLPVAPGAVVAAGDRTDLSALPPGRCIVKPARSDASEGIRAETSIADRDDPCLLAAIGAIHESLAQPALVEQLVGTREVNVSLIEIDGEVRVLPLAEIDFSAFDPGKPRVVDYAAKWLEGSFEFHNTPRVIPAPLPQAQADRLRSLARAAWDTLGCRDYARVDFRTDDDGNAWILEVNPNPDIAPDAGFAAALAAGEVSFEAFVQAMVANAARRAGHTASAPPTVAPGSGVEIRPTVAADRDEIVGFAASTGFFQPGELTIAAEVLDDSIASPGVEYESWTALYDGRVGGWVCFGPTPCTIGTFDLYWIAVDRALQGRGVGRALMDHAERLIRRRGGRLVIVETAGRPDYEPTRQFYIRLNYAESARVPDFYGPGDDKVVYTKTVGA